MLRLNVLRFSPAQRLYARHGFVVDSADEVDVYMSRPARAQSGRSGSGQGRRGMA